MKTDRRSWAVTLIAWSAALLPAERASWAAAMRAEVNAIEDADAALSFAAGCVWGAIKERTMTMNFAARSVRFATMAGMLALSIAAAVIATRLAGVHAASALVFSLTSALFAGATVWSYLRGPMALVQTASSMIPLYVIAYAFLSLQRGTASEWVNTNLYHALAIEGVVIWAALLASGIFMLSFGPLTNTARMGDHA